MDSTKNHTSEVFKQQFRELDGKTQKTIKRDIMYKCDINESTFYRWLRGEIDIRKVYYPIIATAFGVAVDVIFPESDNNNTIY